MEAYHPNQNLCERRGGMLKAATSHLLLVTGAPLEYWCYALEYIVLLQSVIAHWNLNLESPHTLHFGDTPNISVFRFVFWSPVWYYAPSNSFPNSKMLPRRFIGIARNVGDAFCFLIVIHDDDPDKRKIIARSVIRHRYPRETPPTVDAREYNSLKFYKNDGKTGLEDPVDTSGFSLSDHILPEKSFSHSLPDMVDSSADKDDHLRDAIAEVYGPPTKRQRVEFTDPLAVATGDIDKVVPLPRPPSPRTPTEDSSKPSAQTKVPDTLPAPRTPTSPVDTSTSTTELGRDNDPEEPIPVSTLADAVEQPEDCPSEIFEDMMHHLEQLAEDDPQDDLFEKVVTHGWDNGILILEIEWKTGETSSLPFTLVKRDYPYAVAQYILDHNVGTWDGQHTSGRYTRWARGFLRQVNRTICRLHRVVSGSIL